MQTEGQTSTAACAASCVADLTESDCEQTSKNSMQLIIVAEAALIADCEARQLLIKTLHNPAPGMNAQSEVEGGGYNAESILLPRYKQLSTEVRCMLAH